MSETLTRLQAAFRAAAADIDPTRGRPAEVSADLLDAWLVVHAVRGQARWLEAALQAADALEKSPALPSGDAARWLSVACSGWVLRASRGFRGLADRLAEAVPPGPASVAPLLRYWRITGLRRIYDRALGQLPDSVQEGDFVAGAAAWAAYLATARPELADQARRGFQLDPADVPLRYWPAMAAARDLGPDAAKGALDRMDASPAEPAALLPAVACLALPILRLRVDWWIDSELREGPMAEAATYPYPALRISFDKLPMRDQLRFTPSLDGEVLETIVDAGVVVVGLEMIVEDVDRSGLLESAGRGRRSSRLRR